MSNFKDNSGLDVIKPKMTKEDSDVLMKRFLEKGGKIQKLKPGYPINVGSLDRSKKPQWTREDIKEAMPGGANSSSRRGSASTQANSAQPFNQTEDKKYLQTKPGSLEEAILKSRGLIK